MLPNDPADDAYLLRQVEATISNFDDVFDAIHEGRDLVDATGYAEDPNITLRDLVPEVTTFTSIRLTISGGGPSVAAEAEVDHNGEIRRPRVVATSMSGRVERELRTDSGLAAALQLHASALGL